MESLTNLFASLWDIWKEMFGAIIEIAPKVLSFILWVICGILILPCVFVAGTWFPKWTEWGEKSF